jgi:hypothetical protein
MLGLEAYETFPDGSKRYLSPDEIRRDISFAGGEFFVTPSNTIAMVAKRVRTSLPALTRYLDRFPGLTSVDRGQPNRKFGRAVGGA